MKLRECANAAFHTAGGCALASTVVWSSWFAVLVVFVFAALREQAQHRLRLEEHHYLSREAGHPVYIVEKRGFFDWSWFRWKHAFEIAEWTLGAAGGVGLAKLLW